MSIDIDRKGQVAVITINRPDARNALDPEHNDALGAAVADFEVAIGHERFPLIAEARW